MNQHNLIKEIVQKIAEIAKPQKIILFGSAARDEMNGHSDIDLMVVKENCDRSKLAQDIYPKMIGYDVSVDIVFVSPEDLEKYRDSKGLIYYYALKDGQEVYAA